MLGRVALALLASSVPANLVQDQPVGPRSAEWAPHRALKILYAGYPEGSREAAFESFLGEWFDKVGTIHLKDLSMATAADWDLVIADWTSQYGKDGYEAPEGLTSAPANLGDDFTKPVIAMTYVGTQIRRQGKLDWL